MPSFAGTVVNCELLVGKVQCGDEKSLSHVFMKSKFGHSIESRREANARLGRGYITIHSTLGGGGRDYIANNAGDPIT